MLLVSLSGKLYSCSVHSNISLGTPAPSQGPQGSTFIPGARGSKATVINHQTPVLHNFDAFLCESLRNRLIADSRLHPNRPWVLRQHVLEMRVNIFRPAEDVHHIDLNG